MVGICHPLMDPPHLRFMHPASLMFNIMVDAGALDRGMVRILQMCRYVKIA